MTVGTPAQSHITALISAYAFPHQHGDERDCHPDDETKLILLAFVDH